MTGVLHHRPEDPWQVTLITAAAEDGDHALVLRLLHEHPRCVNDVDEFARPSVVSPSAEAVRHHVSRIDARRSVLASADGTYTKSWTSALSLAVCGHAARAAHRHAKAPLALSLIGLDREGKNAAASGAGSPQRARW